MGLIREGNERVLAARLADAKFFFDEDRKVRLEDRVKKLDGCDVPSETWDDGAEAGAA